MTDDRFPDCDLLPASRGAAAAGPPAAETAEAPAAEATPTAAEAAAGAAETTAAKRPRSAGPVAPRTVAPVAPPAAPVAAGRGNHDHDDPENQEPGKVSARPRRRGPVGRHVGNGHSALFTDAIDQPGRRGQQPRAEVAAAEGRRDRFADGFAGVGVGDDGFEVVADLELHFAIVHRDEQQQAVVLPLVADAAAAVLEHLDGVLLDGAERLDRADRGDDEDVAGGRL